MRISDHLLCILAAHPDPLSPVQFDKWLGELYKAGCIEKAPGLNWQLTEKGRRLAAAAEIKIMEVSTS